MKIIEKIEKEILKREIRYEEALELSKIENKDIFKLIDISFKLNQRLNKTIHVCSILNAKSGLCPQNCSYCAQSMYHKTDINTYGLLEEEEIIRQAEKVYSVGVRHFGILTSGYGYKKPDEEFNKIIRAIKTLKSKFPDLDVCASLGILSEETAKILFDAGIVEYNHNLQVNPDKYRELIADTHSVEERINTIKILKKYPIRICSGCIIGLGETMEDRIKLAFLLKEIDADIIPINVLIPIKGTRLENQKPISALEVVKTFAIYRIILKNKTIKFAAGRETIMKDFQGLIMLAGANGILTGGYLTTRGRNPEDDLKLIEELDEFKK